MWMPLTLEASKDIVMRCLVYAAYGVQIDTKRHSEVLMLLWKGYMQSNSSKKTVNKWSLIEDEIFGANHHMSGILWSMLLPEFQGCIV